MVLTTPDGAALCATATMDTSSQRRASALPPMQERHGLRSGAGGRLPLVLSEHVAVAGEKRRIHVEARV
jgi:hypothetical protein